MGIIIRRGCVCLEAVYFFVKTIEKHDVFHHIHRNLALTL